MSRTAAAPTVLFAGAAALAIGLAPPAGVAGPDRGGAERRLARLDLNGDGRITRQEAKALGTIRFLRWDRDGDGVLTRAEIEERARERRERRIGKAFARLDRNGDGRIEWTEFEARARARFARADANGDGVLTEDEIRSARRQARPPREDE